MGMIIAEVTVVPLGTASTSLSTYIAEVEKVLNKFPKIKSMLTPMSTILEGEMDEVMEAIKAVHDVPFQMGAQRVSTTLRIDDRRDKRITMAGKVAAVKNRLCDK
jgi:uncharacterized protein (TIGR00106 family)